MPVVRGENEAAGASYSALSSCAGARLDPRNFITLCEEGGYLNCHLFHGHNGDWKSFNDKVREECEEHKRTPDAQILRAIRKQDPGLYDWLIKAKKLKGK